MKEDNITKKTEIIIIIDDKELAVGVKPYLIIPQIYVGRVELAPITKLVIINSSKETANTKIEPPIIEGKIIGKVTVLNTLLGLEPRSLAASSIERSKFISLDRIIKIKKGIQKRICAADTILSLIHI